VRKLIDERRLFRDVDGVWNVADSALSSDPSQTPLSDTLQEAIHARLRRLTAIQREVLETIAVLRRATSGDAVAAILHLDAGPVENALDALAARRLLVAADGDQWAPRVWEF
jgi:predicted ATPase